MNLIECKVKFEKVLENGMRKKVTESYLVDALSFTEAEARIIEELKPFITGGIKASAVKQEKYSELFVSSDNSSYFKCKVSFITLDVKSGAEKATPAYMLVGAGTLPEAVGVLENGMKGTISTYTIDAVSKTAIMDVFLYDAE